MIAKQMGYIDITCNMIANVLNTSNKYVLLLEKLLCYIIHQGHAAYNYFTVAQGYIIYLIYIYRSLVKW
jgi:hypothetical protein